MNKLLIFYTILGLLTVAFVSCEDPVTEGVTLSDIVFPISIDPDSAWIEVGDTFNLHSSVKNNIDGINLKDGKINLHCSIGFYAENPITPETDARTATEGLYFITIPVYGEVLYSNNKVNSILADINSDSIRIKLQFKLLRKGVYHFKISPSFFDGSQGKARTDGNFDVSDPHWDFFSGWDQPNPNPIDPIYYKSYLIEVK